jgi:hypothetical protein
MPGAVPPDVSKAIQVRMKTRRKKGGVAGRGILPPIKSLLPIASGSKKWIKQTYPSENISINRPYQEYHILQLRN